MPKLRLNDTVVRKLPSDCDKTDFHRDTEVSGLAVRVTKAGHKAFVFSYSVNGREISTEMLLLTVEQLRRK